MQAGRATSQCIHVPKAYAAIDSLIATAQPPSSSFPHIIHQSWKDGSLPPNFQNWSQSWSRLHPSYEYKLWTDRDNHDLVAQHFPSFLPIYEGLDHKIKRADVVRFLYMYHYGGVYADLDFLALRPFDSLLDQFKDDSVLLGYLGNDPGWMHSIPNALMISKRHAPFWLHTLRLVLGFCTGASTSPEAFAGPVLLRAAVQRFGNQSSVRILPQDYFYGAHAGARGSWRPSSMRSTPTESSAGEAYAVTFWQHSWGPQPTRDMATSKAQGAPSTSSQPDSSSTQGPPNVRQQKVLAHASHKRDYAAYRNALKSFDLRMYAMRSYYSDWWHAGLPGGTSCSRMERIGSLGDAGKLICEPKELFSNQCNVVSIGSNGDTAFEDDVHTRWPHCQITTIDGTLIGKRAHLGQRLEARPWLNFVASNFNRTSWKLFHGKGSISLLKIDCQGCEYEALIPFLEHIPTAAINMEVHGHLGTRVPRRYDHQTAPMGTMESVLALIDKQHELMSGLDRLGFKIFAAEPNILYSDGTCIEFSFKREPSTSVHVPQI